MHRDVISGIEEIIGCNIILSNLSLQAISKLNGNIEDFIKRLTPIKESERSNLEEKQPLARVLNNFRIEEEFVTDNLTTVSE